MRKVTEICENEKKFFIVATHGGYMAIDADWLDGNGCLNRAVNGIQGHFAKTPDDCISNLRFHLKVERLMNSGLSLNEALRAACEKKGA